MGVTIMYKTRLLSIFFRPDRTTSHNSATQAHYYHFVAQVMGHHIDLTVTSITSSSCL